MTNFSTESIAQFEMKIKRREKERKSRLNIVPKKWKKEEKTKFKREGSLSAHEKRPAQFPRKKAVFLPLLRE